MHKHRFIVIAILALALPGCLITTDAGADGAPGPDGLPGKPYVALSGHDSAITERRCVRVTDAETWAALWKEHRGEKLETNASGWPTTPVIDFERCMVIAVFRGESWNANGEYVESIEEVDRHVRLRFDSHTFQTSGPDGGGVRVTPFGIWVIARTEKPIVIEENVQGLIGQPPKWKEQWRFAGL